MGSVEIPDPVEGWNPVPGDPKAMVWWDGSAFTAEAIRARGRWEVIGVRGVVPTPGHGEPPVGSVQSTAAPDGTGWWRLVIGRPGRRGCLVSLIMAAGAMFVGLFAAMNQPEDNPLNTVSGLLEVVGVAAAVGYLVGFVFTWSGSRRGLQPVGSWRADPTGRAVSRWWSGTEWTTWIQDRDGIVRQDPDAPVR